MEAQPYLFFDGRCEEAIQFYQAAVGAQTIMKMRFNESPESPAGAPNGDKIMHGALRIGNSTVLVSDGECTGSTSFAGFALSLTPATDADAQRLFAALADGGQVQVPLTKTFFSSQFGCVKDRFGLSWMIYVPPAESA